MAKRSNSKRNLQAEDIDAIPECVSYRYVFMFIYSATLAGFDLATLKLHSNLCGPRRRAQVPTFLTWPEVPFDLSRGQCADLITCT
jgi:hypothetical protein